jgi:hypothetical protein
MRACTRSCHCGAHSAPCSCNGWATWGLQYQCVELVQRFSSPTPPHRPCASANLPPPPHTHSPAATTKKCTQSITPPRCAASTRATCCPPPPHLFAHASCQRGLISIYDSGTWSTRPRPATFTLQRTAHMDTLPSCTTSTAATSTCWSRTAPAGAATVPRCCCPWLCATHAAAAAAQRRTASPVQSASCAPLRTPPPQHRAQCLYS